MSTLSKDWNIEVIAGTPGNPAQEAIPAKEGRWHTAVFSVGEWRSPGDIEAEEGYSGIQTTEHGGIAGIEGNSLIFGDGYADHVISGGSSNKNYFIITGYSTITTWEPATPFVPAVPASPATQTEVKRYKNEGWNTSARSIEPLDTGEYFQFNVMTDISGGFFAIGAPGLDLQGISQFSHAFIVDQNGVHVFNYGELVTTIKNLQQAASILRIYRHADGHIVFVCITGAETLVYTSDILYNKYIPSYIYSMLYSSGDTVLSASIDTGEVQYGSITFDIELDFSVLNCAIRFDIELDFVVSGEQFGSIVFDIEIDSYFNGEFNYGFAMLPSLQSIGGEIPEDYGAGFAMLPAMQSSGSGGFYEPPPLEYGFGYLPALISFGIVTDIDNAEGDSMLPSLQSKGGEGDYGEGYAMLPSIRSQGYEGWPSNVAPIISGCRFFSGILPQYDQIVFINSSGVIVDSITYSREYIASILSSLVLTESYTIIGEFTMPINSTATASTTAQATRGITTTTETVEESDTGTEGVVVTTTEGPYGEIIVTTVTTVEDEPGHFVITTVVETTAFRPAVDPGTRVWVVNIDTQATGQYDNYGFNSWFDDVDGVDYGLADDGIYELTGDTDNGFEIDALIQCGKSNLGTPNKKGLVNVYSGVSSSGKMILKVDADGAVYYYEARSSSTTMKNHRFDVGKGLRGNYYDFDLMNQNGDDFDLEMIHFEPVVLKGKI